MAINNGEVIGKPQKNLILETAGRIYVKVADRYYELNFRNQGSTTKIVGVPQVAPTETTPKEEIDLSDYVTSAELKQTLKKYVTERSWQDVKDTQAALENAMIEGFSESINPITVQTMQVTVGSEQYQFDIIKSFINKALADAPLYLDVKNEYHLTFNPCFIKHYTIDGPNAVQPDADKEYWRWYIDCSDNWNKEDGEKEIILLSNETYYFYFKVPFVNNIDVAEDDVIGGGTNGANLYLKDGALANKTGSGIYAKTGVGKLVYTTEAQEFETVDENGVTWYNLLYAIVANSDGEPSISTMNGYTEILPGQITAYLFKNASGTSYLDLNSNQFVLGVDSENPLLAFNQDGRGTLYLKGAIVQDKGGNAQPPTIYRDTWSASNTYCPGNIVIYSNSDGVVGSYRFTGILPASDNNYVYTDNKSNDGQSTGSGKTYKYLEEYERECGTAGSPLEDTTHWICVSSGSKTIVTAGLYYVDSDNDFIAVPTDSDDLILLSNINTDITLSAYEGASEMNITDISVSIPSDISNAVTVTKAVNGNIKIQNISFNKGVKFAGTNQITFTVSAQSTTDSSVEITKDFKFTVSAVKNADPTTIYQLKPSLAIIKKDTSNNYQEESITCDVIKISPNGREVITTDWGISKINVTYKIDNGDVQNYSYGNAIKTNSISSKIEFTLTINSATWDKETVFVVSDGSNGKNGEDGTIISSVVEYYYASSNSTLSDSEKELSNWTLNKIPDNYGINAPYLWNCEVVQDNLGNTLNVPIYALISYYGKDGRGITKIINYYLATNSNTIPTYGSSEVEIINNGWQTSSSTTKFSENGNKYLWNLEVITYTDGSITITEPAIISILTEGVRGADAPIVRYSKWKSNTVYNDGTQPEVVGNKNLYYLDFVYDTETKLYYQCLSYHTSGSTFAGDSSKWSVINNFKPIATSVIFAGEDARGWIIDEGEIKHSENKSLLTNAGEIYLGNSDTSKEPTADTANFSVDADGKVTISGDIYLGETHSINMGAFGNVSQFKISSDNISFESNNKITRTTQQSTSVMVRLYRESQDSDPGFKKSGTLSQEFPFNYTHGSKISFSNDTRIAYGYHSSGTDDLPDTASRICYGKVILKKDSKTLGELIVEYDMSGWTINDQGQDMQVEGVPDIYSIANLLDAFNNNKFPEGEYSITLSTYATIDKYSQVTDDANELTLTYTFFLVMTANSFAFVQQYKFNIGSNGILLDLDNGFKIILGKNESNQYILLSGLNKQLYKMGLYISNDGFYMATGDSSDKFYKLSTVLSNGTTYLTLDTNNSATFN